jgi:hypothetical protein
MSTAPSFGAVNNGFPSSSSQQTNRPIFVLRPPAVAHLTDTNDEMDEETGGGMD